MTGVGAAVDVAGIILLATAKAPKGRAGLELERPTFAVAPSVQPVDRGVVVGFGGRW